MNTSILTSYNQGVANYLGLDSIEFMEDTFNESNMEIIVIEVREWISGFFFPKVMRKEIRHRLYAKKALFYKDCKRFLIVIPPMVKGYEYDLDAMIDYLKNKILTIDHSK